MTDNLPQRKHPAHRPPVERHNEPVILFVTIGTMPRVPVFANHAFHDAFMLACGDADAWLVGKYVVMPDHIHLFCAPATFPRIAIKRWSGYLKERITKRLKKMHLEGEAVLSRMTKSGSPQVRPPSAENWLERNLEGEAVLSREQGTSMNRASDRRNGQVCSTHAHLRPRGSAPDFAEASSGRQPRPPDAVTKPSRTWKWQSDCWDTQIRSGTHYHEKWEYVRLNPVRKELVTTPEDWPWQRELSVLRW
jgi:REP element-mobilizing transposase RayT